MAKRKQLENAIRKGDLDKVRALIRGGADVSSPLADETTPIQLAAREGQMPILRALAAAGAELSDLESLDFQERMKLYLEASIDQMTDDDLLSPEELTQWAMEAVSEQMDSRLAAEIAELEGDVFRAVRTEDLEGLRERIAAGDDVNQICGITRDSPLTRALQSGDEEMVGELIRAGADVNHKGYMTPLSFALPDLRLVKLLLDAGADPYVRGLDSTTPLERAVFRTTRPDSAWDSPLLVRFFLEAGIDPSTAESGPGSFLLDAEVSEAWELYHELLPHYSDEIARESFEEIRSKEDMNKIDGGLLQWRFDLAYAARQGDLDELRTLLAERPMGPATESERCDEASPPPPLGSSLESPRKDAGRAVLEAIAAPLSAESPRGTRQLEAVRILIEAGADLDFGEGYQKERGTSPLAAAAESWQPHAGDAMRLLLDAGADVNQRGSFDRTPLMHAVLVTYRHGAALKKALPLLLEAGADPNLEDQYGLSAWMLAKAPLIEAEERSRLDLGEEGMFFDGPDLSELYSERANKADRKRDRLDRCREVLELLEAAGAEGRGADELRLVLAAAAGDVERVDELLRAGARPNARRTDGHSAIALAAKSGCLEIVERLIAAGCEVDAKAIGLPSAVETAIENTDLEMTKRLIDAGSNVLMMTCMSSGNLLIAAEEAGATELVEMVRAALPPKLAYLDRDVEQEMAAEDLIFASRRDLPHQAALGHSARVRELLEIDGVEVDGYDAFRRTALMAAAEAGHVEMTRELLALGADPNICNEVTGSPRSTPLACAVISAAAERDAVIRLLLEAGADPNRIGADGRTALMHAVERDVGFFGRTGGAALSTRTLLEAEVDLEIRDRYSLTAWMRAMSLASSIEIEEISEQYEAVARLLEDAGASTAGLPSVELIWAVTAGDIEAVREILQAGADVDTRRHDGASALMLASRDGHRDIATLLVETGCDVDAQQWVDRGLTAMAGAVKAGDPGLVRMLSAAGASAVEV